MNSNYLEKIQTLQSNLKHLSVRETISLQKRTSNLFRNRPDHAHAKLDVKSLNQVIKINVAESTAEVEGMITFEALVAETLKHNLLPAVVPELKSITVGGAYVGCGIESSSWKYGLVHETVEEVDVLLATGDLVTATPTNEHQALFWGLPNSYGTLGYVTRLKIKCIPAKKFVKITHHALDDSQKVWKKIDEIIKAGAVDYLEAVMFAPQKFVITTGVFTDEAPQASNYKYMAIYYRSLLEKKEDYLTASDYIWRWDSDWFWCSKFFFMQHKLPRFLFGKFMLKSTAYWKIRHAVNNHPWLARLLMPRQKPVESVIQDVQIPLAHCEEFANFFLNTICILPVWFCPLVPTARALKYTLYPMTPGEIHVNFGFWESVPSTEGPGFYNRFIEQKVTDFKGHKSLYSDSYYTPEQFWDIYDQKAYESLKNTYDPQKRFKSLYEKCVKASTT
jgi:FAD/FMN-containing dehydrogenase